MKVSIRTIRNTVMVYTHGQIQKDMQVGGAMANNMV
jgi:hypothetical protein